MINNYFSSLMKSMYVFMKETHFSDSMYKDNPGKSG